MNAVPLIKWVGYRRRAEFIRPTAFIITIGNKEATPLLEHWSNEFDPTVLLTGGMRFVENVDLSTQSGGEPNEQAAHYLRE